MPEDQRSEPLSDTQQTVARSAARLSRIKTIQHSDTATLCGRSSVHGPQLLKTSKTMWTQDITSVSAHPLVCGTGQA
jgi:hypothetical protein